MKYLFWVLTILICVNCSKKNEKMEVQNCIEMQVNQNFEEIEFKEHYTIQLPIDFSGVGLELLFGTRFSVKTELGTKLFYEYLCDTDCSIYFGKNLQNPAPDVIIGFPAFPTEVLEKSHEYCVAGELKAILYYSSNHNSIKHGKLFMKEDLDFKEGLLLEFKSENISEVNSIIKTIVKR